MPNGTADGEDGGEDITQTFTVTENPKWRILGYEDGKVLLTTDEPIKDTNSKGLVLGGREAFVYGTKVLDEISKIYAHGDGAETESARSITVEDINKLTGINPNDESENYNKTFMYKKNTNDNPYVLVSDDDGNTWYDYDPLLAMLDVYGEENFTYYDGTNWISLEDGATLSEEDMGLSEASLINNAYEYTIPENLSAAKKDLISRVNERYNADLEISYFDGFYYWIASPCIYCTKFKAYAEFGLFEMRILYRENAGVTHGIFGYSNSEQGRITEGDGLDVRPVITLNESTIINPCTGENSISNPHTISNS